MLPRLERREVLDAALEMLCVAEMLVPRLRQGPVAHLELPKLPVDVWPGLGHLDHYHPPMVPGSLTAELEAFSFPLARIGGLL